MKGALFGEADKADAEALRSGGIKRFHHTKRTASGRDNRIGLWSVGMFAAEGFCLGSNSILDVLRG